MSPLAKTMEEVKQVRQEFGEVTEDIVIVIGIIIFFYQ